MGRVRFQFCPHCGYTTLDAEDVYCKECLASDDVDVRLEEMTEEDIMTMDAERNIEDYLSEDL